MDSMIGGVLGLGWLPALLAVVLIVAGVMLGLRRFGPAGQRGAHGIGHLILTLLAIIGGITLVAALAL